MNVTIPIDPGFSKKGRGCACSLFADGVLQNWWFARPTTAGSILRSQPWDAEILWSRDVVVGTPVICLPRRADCLIVIEQPQVDDRSPGKTRTLIELAWQGALLAGIYAGQVGAGLNSVPPATWKRSVPKPIHHHRLWEILTDDEHDLIGGEATEQAIEQACERGALDRWSKPGVEYYRRGWDLHNALDSIALGAWKEGRLG